VLPGAVTLGAIIALALPLPSQTRAVLVGLALAWTPGCRTLCGPADVAQAYATALDEGRLEAAYQLTAQEFRARTSLEAFLAQYRDAAVRRSRAQGIRQALPTRVSAAGFELVQEPGAWRVNEPSATDEATLVLRRFLDAAQAGDFAKAYRLLSARWRAQYTPERLARDLAVEPQGKERLARARAALETPLQLEGDAARFPLGGELAVKLVREQGTFRVDSLE
jgi:hypothetical protein